jgi:hypothetical protein
MSKMVKYWVRGIVMVVLVVGLTAGARADTTDNFDSYTAGVVIPAGNGWVGWGGPSANGIVTAGPSNSAPNSLAVVGGAGTDQVLELGYGEKLGKWTFSTMTFVPAANKAGETYFNLMNTFDDANGIYKWSHVGVHWMMDANHEKADKVFNDDTPAGDELDLIYDQWVEVTAEIDLINNLCEVFYGGVSLSAAAEWSGEPVLGIDVMDIYPISGDASVMYYDDISLVQTEIPEPATMSLLALGGLAVLRRRRRQ